MNRSVFKDQEAIKRNLKRLTNEKRIKTGDSVVDSAGHLGWNPSTLRGYLGNNSSKIGPTAVLKLADWLECCPTEITPEIAEYLPSYEAFDLRYSVSDASKKNDDRKRQYRTLSPNSQRDCGIFGIEIDEPISWTLENGDENIISTGVLVVIERPDPSLISQDSLWVVRLAKESRFRVLRDIQLPASKLIKSKFLLRCINLIPPKF